ncbi:hypothetical protein [Desulfovibrio sp.]|uniref:hypothetical protein n=1 Tax=Desulfovibrio sp. TaxID=885 RepID=UPI003D129CA5
MKALRYIGLLLIVGLLAACGAQKRTVQLPPIQASQQSGSLVAQFGARLTLAGQSAPVQGEVQMTESGGSLALILPHGRTLGVCTYSPDVAPDSEPKGATGAQSVKMQCTPAEGMGREAASLLVRAGVAVYRILPALGQDTALTNLEGNGWKARFNPSADGLNGVYSEQDGMTMDMYFVEISHL